MKVLWNKLENFEALSLFGRIPICNLANTLEASIIKTIDVLFARELEKNFCVWWYSRTTRPDLGTKEILGIEQETIFSKEDTKCEIQTPCISDEYVFEIDVLMFHFNTLIVSEI